MPVPTGVVATFAPQDSALLGLVSVVAPIIVTGNTCVAVASQQRPLPAITLAEILATSDLPAGVLNILTGDPAEIGPWLAGHSDVNALDLTGVPDDAISTQLQVAAAGTVKRVLADATGDWNVDPGLGRLRAFTEISTVWHPQGV
jgi:acyl-CoA reductase-like NAD-dependent aldehyde dehydrogenase